MYCKQLRRDKCEGESMLVFVQFYKSVTLRNSEKINLPTNRKKPPPLFYLFSNMNEVLKVIHLIFILETRNPNAFPLGHMFLFLNINCHYDIMCNLKKSQCRVLSINKNIIEKWYLSEKKNHYPHSQEWRPCWHYRSNQLWVSTYRINSSLSSIDRDTGKRSNILRSADMF